MNRYSPLIQERVHRLRALGKTYSEIKKELHINFPKSSLYELCKGVVLPDSYAEKVGRLNYENFQKARAKAHRINQLKRQEFLKSIRHLNWPISKKVLDNSIAKIALAMLCLGEASKYGSGAVFSLGSSNPKIIKIFLGLLRRCFDFDLEKIRCTVQCRADQDVSTLEKFWLEYTGIPRRLFYKTRIDPRTIGKPTRKSDYKGVLKVDYIDTKVQLELESLAELIYNQVNS